MTGLMGDILECVAKEYREWRNGGQQPKWFPAKRSLQKVSELEGNGDLVKAFEEFQDGQKKWKNHPSVIEAFVSGRATRLFLALVYSNTLPLIDQFCTHGIGDKLFASLNPKWEANHVTFNEKPDIKLEFDDRNQSLVDHLINTCRPAFFVNPLAWTKFDSPSLPTNCTLPFLEQSEISDTAFSTVYKVVVHKSYIEQSSEHFKIATNGDGHPYVARKSLKMSGLDKAGHEAFVKSEYETLDMLRDAKSQHLIKAIAFYRADGGGFNFMLPFAQQGNLRTFWKTYTPRIDDAKYMRWVFDQLEGLATAIQEMHGEGPGKLCRHGDLKPENILCFESKQAATAQDQTSCVLVIADVGISRTHDKVTEQRGRTKLAKADTIAYAAPETELSPDKATSRRADIWSLGCLYLEFLIWLLRGQDGLQRFNSDIGKNGKFYTTSKGQTGALEPGTAVAGKVAGEAKVNPEVGRWIKNLKNDLRCVGTDTKKTALSRLLSLVEERMLHLNVATDRTDPLPESSNGNPARVASADVGTASTISERSQDSPQFNLNVRVPTFPNGVRSEVTGSWENERAYSKEVCEILQAIRKDTEARDNLNDTNKRVPPTYNNPSLVASAKGKSFPLKPVPVVKLPTWIDDRSKHPNDKWNYVSDIIMTRELRIELGQPHRSKEPSKLCGRCSKLPLWSRDCSFDDTVTELVMRENECSICRLIYGYFEKRNILPDDILHFFRVDSYLFYNNNQLPPILSLCTLPQSYDVNEKLESNIRLGYATLSNVSSPLHTKLLREWLRDCDMTHQCLGSPDEPPFLPTRLLDVGKRGSTRTHLICDTAKLDAQKVKYLALSHRWGPPRVSGENYSRWDKFVCTFMTNIEAIVKGIDDSALPEKYQDAISVARRLGVRYLWIDSLCIIQEDKSNPEDEDKGRDFKKEAERMEMVFRSAYATLAASCSSSSEEKFLKRREKGASVTMQAGTALYYLSNAIDDFYGDVEQGTLNQRGWVFQERALSRRTIHFTETQTYWECGEGVRCETLMKAKSPTPSFLSDAHFPSSLLKYGAGKSFELYQDLYARYSRLALSHITDRPVAIRGLETRLLSILRTAGGYGVFDNDLCRGLLWQREEASIGLVDFSVSGAQNTVPSWSWMAHAGPIRYMNVPLEWTPCHSEITSPWKAGKSTSKAELLCCVRDMQDIEPGVQIFLDDSSRTFGSSFKCVVLGSSKMPDGSDKCYALIVIPASEGVGEEDVYARAGVASLMHRHIVWESCAKARLL